MIYWLKLQHKEEIINFKHRNIPHQGRYAKLGGQQSIWISYFDQGDHQACQWWQTLQNSISWLYLLHRCKVPHSSKPRKGIIQITIIKHPGWCPVSCLHNLNDWHSIHKSSGHNHCTWRSQHCINTSSSQQPYKPMVQRSSCHPSKRVHHGNQKGLKSSTQLWQHRMPWTWVWDTIIHLSWKPNKPQEKYAPRYVCLSPNFKCKTTI